MLPIEQHKRAWSEALAKLDAALAELRKPLLSAPPAPSEAPSILHHEAANA